jgi:hypothetical protein
MPKLKVPKNFAGSFVRAGIAGIYGELSDRRAFLSVLKKLNLWR